MSSTDSFVCLQKSKSVLYETSGHSLSLSSHNFMTYINAAQQMQTEF